METTHATLDAVIKAHIETVLDATHCHQLNAAKILGISPKTLYRKMRSYGWTKRTMLDRSKATPSAPTEPTPACKPYDAVPELESTEPDVLSAGLV